MAPFCKVCFAAGKTEEEYTSHFVRSEPGPNGFVVCPHLLSLECRYCRQKGHTPKHCPKLGDKYIDPRPAPAVVAAPVRKPKMMVDDDGWVTKTNVAPRIVFEKATVAKAKSPERNQFGVLTVEEDVEVEKVQAKKEPAVAKGPQLQDFGRRLQRKGRKCLHRRRTKRPLTMVMMLLLLLIGEKWESQSGKMGMMRRKWNFFPLENLRAGRLRKAK